MSQVAEVKKLNFNHTNFQHMIGLLYGKYFI